MTRLLQVKTQKKDGGQFGRSFHLRINFIPFLFGNGYTVNYPNWLLFSFAQGLSRWSPVT